MKPEYQVEITDLSQVNDKLYHMLSLLQMGLIHALTYTSTLTVGMNSGAPEG
jgi:hypothetical protein